MSLGNVGTTSPRDSYQTYVLVTYGGLSGIRIRALLNSGSEEPQNSPPPPSTYLSNVCAEVFVDSGLLRSVALCVNVIKLSKIFNYKLHVN